MSEIESKVKAIIVDKLGVDEADVKPEASFMDYCLTMAINCPPKGQKDAIGKQ